MDWVGFSVEASIVVVVLTGSVLFSSSGMGVCFERILSFRLAILTHHEGYVPVA